MYKDYYQEVYKKDIDRIITLTTDSGEIMTVNELDANINSYLTVEHCKIKIAQLGDKLIGFMVYHLAFDCILLCRGVYFVPEFRKSSLLRGLTYSIGNILRTYSTTHVSGGPKEIQGEKPNRKLVTTTDTMMVWENITRGKRG